MSKKTVSQVMSPQHPDWKKFYRLLAGKEGCNFKKDPKKGLTWKCKGRQDKSLAEAILKKHFPEINITETLVFFEEHGGHCDCEIIFNVSDRD